MVKARNRTRNAFEALRKGGGRKGGSTGQTKKPSLANRGALAPKNGAKLVTVHPGTPAFQKLRGAGVKWGKTGWALGKSTPVCAESDESFVTIVSTVIGKGRDETIRGMQGEDTTKKLDKW